MSSHLRLAVLLLATAGSCAAPSRPFTRPIATREPRAQELVSRGLLYCYGFNHEKAIATFKAAIEADPSCAMAHWGHALALGPHINAPSMSEASSRAAFAAATRARELAVGAPPVERALIDALAHRYASSPPADRKPLDRAYADAMRPVWQAHSDDPDVGALFAEALLDLRPWDQWTRDGEPQPGTLEAIETCEAVLRDHPDHAGASHMLIHALEASPHPERALAAADRLRFLVPDSGHLLHMPAHIDMRLGRYADAIACNQRAIAADDRERAAGPIGGTWPGYRAHNHRHLAWSAMYDGRKEIALDAARDMVRKLEADGIAKARPQSVEAGLALPWHVLARFGDWEAILAEPKPAPEQPALLAFWHHSRALAFSSLRRVDEADVELAAFERAIDAVPPDYRLGKNSARDVLEVARPFTQGELAYRHGDVDRAFELLREAVKREESLRYSEPWDWLQPVRHALGALLLEQGRLDEAESVYRADLARHPENGWALHGLAECLRRSGRDDDARRVQSRFERAWARADVTLSGSCFCRIGA